MGDNSGRKAEQVHLLSFNYTRIAEKYFDKIKRHFGLGAEINYIHGILPEESENYVDSIFGFGDELDDCEKHLNSLFGFVNRVLTI